MANKSRETANLVSSSGISTLRTEFDFINGPVQIGTATSTGTASQRLQVTGGAYVSDNVGVGTTNPYQKLVILGGTHIGQTLALGRTSGSGGFTKATGFENGTALGDLVFDNGTNDSPGVNFYFGNNRNFGIDTSEALSGGGYLASLSGKSNLRFVYNVNETGGVVHAGMNSEGKFFAREFVGINTLGSDIKIQKLNDGPIGFKNLFYNPGFIIDNRHVYGPVPYNVGSATTYTSDRWYAASLGSIVTAQRTSLTGTISSHSPYAMVINGSASNTHVDFGQRLEGIESRFFSGRTLSISCDIMNTAGITSMSIIVQTPSLYNNFSATNEIFNRSVPISGSLTRVSTAVSGISTEVWKGLQVTFRVYGLTSGRIQFERPQLELGPVASEWEMPNPAYEVSRCNRYCQLYDGGGRTAVGNWSGATGAYCTMMLKDQMYSTPTLAFVQPGRVLVEAVNWYDVTAGTITLLESSNSVVTFSMTTANSGQAANANAVWGNGAVALLTSEI